MLIFDGDYPMAPIALDFRRDLTQPIEEVRRREATKGNIGFCSLPEMRKAGIAAAIMKICSDMQRETNSIRGTNTPERTYALGRGQLAYYELLERWGEIRVLRTREDFSAHLAEWEAVAGPSHPAEARAALPVGAVLGLEGADSVVSPDTLSEWWDGGVRVVSLGHYGWSPYAGGTGTGTVAGLLERGPDFLREMDRLGMLLDVTHTSDRAVRDALSIFSGPLLATHSNVRALTPGERQAPDDIIRAVIERDGVMGASMDCFMIHPRLNVDWGQDTWPNVRDVYAREDVSLEMLANHIDYVCQLAGDALHAGIGGDTDGQGGIDNAPIEIDTVDDYNRLADIFRSRGYSEPDVENLMYRNWVRLFERTLPGAA
jgi:membrane dipeptidase